MGPNWFWGLGSLKSNLKLANGREVRVSPDKGRKMFEVEEAVFVKN